MRQDQVGSPSSFVVTGSSNMQNEELKDDGGKLEIGMPNALL